MHVYSNGYEMEGRRRRPYSRLHSSRAAQGWEGHLHLPTSWTCRGERRGISGLEASVWHAAFGQMLARHVLVPMQGHATDPDHRDPEGQCASSVLLHCSDVTSQSLITVILRDGC